MTGKLKKQLRMDNETIDVLKVNVEIESLDMEDSSDIDLETLIVK